MAAGSRQGALVAHAAPNPYRWQRGAQPLIAKVIARHPAEGTVDVQFVSGLGGGIATHVPWMVGEGLSSQTGSQYLPAADATAAIPDPQGPYGIPLPNGATDTYVYVDYAHGSGRQPMVVGVVPSRTSAIAPQTPGWAVHRHESGQWWAIDPAGNLTMGWPDGSTLTVTSTGAAADPTTAINPAWPASSGPDVAVHLRLAGGATLDIVGGQITLNGGTAGVARVGDTVQVDVGGTLYNGTITSGSTTVQAG